MVASMSEADIVLQQDRRVVSVIFYNLGEDVCSCGYLPSAVQTTRVKILRGVACSWEIDFHWSELLRDNCFITNNYEVQ